jgi:DNA-binding CsgD family transcriptional regulator
VAVSSASVYGRHLGESVRERVLELTGRGMSANEIAVAVGCSSRMVTRVRAEARLVKAGDSE